ncbi:MAG: cytochrome c [Pseudomonadota bacterium]
MKMTAWIFCSLLIASVSLAAEPETQEMTGEESESSEELTAVERGKKLHEQNCVKCHGSSLYTRTHRRIKTYAGLISHVQRCATNLNKQWWEEEVADVAEYLNAEFYIFRSRTE